MDPLKELTLELRLAWFQYTISLILIFGYFTLMYIVAVTKAIDAAYLRDMTPILMLVITFWFQRTRPRSTNDNAGSNSGNVTVNNPPPAKAPEANPPEIPHA
jgi:drug/metabolite transporter (DMT)-like permease